MAGAGAPKHTIVLLQETASKSTRTFSDFESVADAMNGICQLYEQRLKQMNPGRLPHLLPPLARRHADQRIERALHVGQGPLVRLITRPGPCELAVAHRTSGQCKRGVLTFSLGARVQACGISRTTSQNSTASLTSWATCAAWCTMAMEHMSRTISSGSRIASSPT